jgi:hypothetical protein
VTISGYYQKQITQQVNAALKNALKVVPVISLPQETKFMAIFPSLV